MRGVYVWKVKEGFEDEFVLRWKKSSDRYQLKPGARGTKLHRSPTDPSLYLGFATWDSLDDRRRAEELMRAEERTDPRLVADETTDHRSEMVFARFFDEPFLDAMPPL